MSKRTVEMTPINVRNIKRVGDELSAEIEWDRFEGEYILTFLQPAMGRHIVELIKDINKGRWGEVVVEEPPVEPKQEIPMWRHLQAEMNRRCVDLGYDSAADAISYATEPSVKEFQDQGKAVRKWRSQVRKYLEDLPQETSVEEALANMPELVL